MILPVFSHCNTITLNLSESFTQKLRNFEDRANRIISNGLNNAHVDLKVPSIVRVRDYNACLLAFKCINNMTSDSFKSYLSLNCHEKTTRNNGKLIRVPKIRLEAARKSFYFQGASKYNKLPVYIRDTDYIVIFKNSIRTHFL